MSPTNEELEAEWSAHSAQSLANFRVDLPRVHHSHGGVHHSSHGAPSGSHHPHGPHLELRQTRSNAGSGWPSTRGLPSGYNGVSAVGHLMAEDFQRGKKQPLRATIASRSNAGRPHIEGAQGARQGPASLPSQVIPRAPIPTPEVLAAKKHSAKSTVKQPKSDVNKNSANNIKSQQPSHPAPGIPPTSQGIYQSPRDRDGDYSYAYDCSISPAVVIKWGEDDEEEDEPIKGENHFLKQELIS